MLDQEPSPRDPVFHFQHACPRFEFAGVVRSYDAGHEADPQVQSTPFILGAVCSHWRQIVWSPPRLWTNIV